MKKPLHPKAAKASTKQPRIRHSRFTGTASEIALPEEPRVDLNARATRGRKR